MNNIKEILELNIKNDNRYDDNINAYSNVVIKKSSSDNLFTNIENDYKNKL